MIIEHLPDEKLMITLEKQRKNGRNDYPVCAIWNTILAGIVFKQRSIESLRKELSRNVQLRYLCRIELSRRLFIPIDRTSYKWKREYNKLTAVERVNSRLDVSFGFANHTILGLKK